MKRFFSIAAAMAGLFTAGNLHAMDVVSEKVMLPFEFEVGNAKMPAGQYRLERDFGRQSVYIVNVDSGRRVQVMRHNGAASSTGATLTFVTTAHGRKLAKVF